MPLELGAQGGNGCRICNGLWVEVLQVVVGCLTHYPNPKPKRNPNPELSPTQTSLSLNVLLCLHQQYESPKYCRGRLCCRCMRMGVTQGWCWMWGMASHIRCTMGMHDGGLTMVGHGVVLASNAHPCTHAYTNVPWGALHSAPRLYIVLPGFT